MICQLSKDYETIKNIMTDPILFGLTNGGVTTRDKFEVDPNYIYLLFKEDDKVIGLVQMHEFNKTTMEVHIFVLPTEWKKGYVKEIAALGHKWIKDKGYIKTIARVPACCSHIHHTVARVGYKLCGQITKGIVFNNILQTLFLYDFEV